MRLGNTTWFKELLADRRPPCVSIYLPVYRANPPAAENPRRFREQLDQVRASLAGAYPDPDVRALVQKIESIPDDERFWTGDRDGVAIFASPDLVRVIDLHRPVDAAVFVADSFHVKPLIRVLQSAWPYHVLTLTQRRVEMFLGAGDVRLERLDATNLPQNPDVVSKMRMSHEVSSQADLRTAETQYPNEGTGASPVTIETFMRAVDKAVWESFSRDSRLPLILCAVEHYHPQFRAVTRNAYLLDEGIKHDPQQMDAERLRQEAWAIMEPRFRAQVEQVKDHFMAAKAHRKGSDELAPVVEAASVGRVGTLLVDGSRQIPGRLHPDTGRIEPATNDNPRADDLLDDLAEMVLRTDGEVMVLPPDMMPNGAGLAAIYRY